VKEVKDGDWQGQKPSFTVLVPCAYVVVLGVCLAQEAQEGI